jgi:hypothetical protein
MQLAAARATKVRAFGVTKDGCKAQRRSSGSTASDDDERGRRECRDPGLSRALFTEGAKGCSTRQFHASRDRKRLSGAITSVSNTESHFLSDNPVG